MRVHEQPPIVDGLGRDRTIRTVSVDHDTLDYPELKIEADRARREWPQTDARVRFVAWDFDDPRISEDNRSWYREIFAHELANRERLLSYSPNKDTAVLDRTMTSPASMWSRLSAGCSILPNLRAG